MSADVIVFTVDIEAPFLDPVEGVRRWLAILGQFEIRATFFVTGSVLSEYPSIGDRICEAGHELASHGYSHPRNPRGPFLDQLGSDGLHRELDMAAASLMPWSAKPAGFRAPWLRTSAAVHAAVADRFAYDSSWSGIAPHFIRNRSIPVLPISSPLGVGPRMGTPPFLALGAGAFLAATRFCWNPIVVYAHSFDLITLTRPAVETRDWKWKWYYRRCGAPVRKFLEEIFAWWVISGCLFMTAEEWLSQPRRRMKRDA